jgi:hypothetical protein
MAPLMDESISLNHLTTEILEACLSREAVAADHREELRAFLKAADCDLIQMQFIALAARLQTGRVFTTTRDLQAFVGAGELDVDGALDVIQACIKFFIVGWHARGAIEDIEKLKRIVRTP